MFFRIFQEKRLKSRTFAVPLNFDLFRKSVNFDRFLTLFLSKNTLKKGLKTRVFRCFLSLFIKFNSEKHPKTAKIGVPKRAKIPGLKPYPMIKIRGQYRYPQKYPKIKKFKIDKNSVFLMFLQ